MASAPIDTGVVRSCGDEVVHVQVTQRFTAVVLVVGVVEHKPLVERVEALAPPLEYPSLLPQPAFDDLWQGVIKLILSEN